jgi:multidrug efflux pump subunit AcrA (membrane-fusion protein)
VAATPANRLRGGTDPSGHDHDDHDHDDHDHSSHDPGHDEAEQEITLSPQARGNLALQSELVSRSSFTQYVSMPGTIIDWPGRTHVVITAPLTGIVSGIYVSHGELIRSGEPLFSLRLTRQDLVRAQSEFLSALGRLDVENREMQRLASAAQNGAVEGKTLIQREYERDKLVAELQAQRQAMLLHGLSESQITSIEDTRELVREVTIFVPVIHGDDSLHHHSEHEHEHGPGDQPHPGERAPQAAEVAPALEPQDVVAPLQPAEADGGIHRAAYTATLRAAEPGQEHSVQQAEFLVTELIVSRGESVEAGKPLGRLSDYSQVLIEGHAFQKDAKSLRSAASLQLALQAVIESAGNRPEIIDGLRIAYIGSEVDLNTWALPFFVSLENRVERSEQLGDERFVSWRFKPGQRLQLRVPLQSLDNVIVVPRDAIAEEGAERYVFVDHGDHFARRPVRIVTRDAISIAIADDGSLKAGEKIAVSGAHQLQMAIKNKSGGGLDRHAGHQH